MEYRRKLLPDEVVLFPPDLTHIFELFIKAGKEIFLVGGGVRNILTMKVPINCDLTTNATPEETQEICKEYEPYYENEYGTVGMPIGNEIYEITTYRSEKEYSDFRHPDEVVWGKTLEEDVTRREFTISAVVIGPRRQLSPASNASGVASAGWQSGGQAPEYELIDLVGGLSDFEEGIIKTVGEPEKRFGEDALRMMRAIRLAATLSFRIEEKTLLAISAKAPLLAKISRERVRDELLKIIASDYPADGMRLLISTGLMEYIMPEVMAGRGMEQKGHHILTVLDHMLESLAFCPSRDPIVRLATFLHDVGKPKTRRFHCANCGKIINESEKRVDDLLVCPNCQTMQTEREATTFYGHEVAGEKMVAKIADNLRLAGKDKEKMVMLVRWHMFPYQPEMTDASIRRFIKRVGKENIGDMMALRIGDRKGGGSKATSWRLLEFQKRIEEQLVEPMEINDMVVDGHDVMEILGIPPGPKIGEVLGALFEEVLEDSGKNNREYLLGRIKQLK